MTWTILQADARHIPLADKSVQCVVTSPPYWGLRDYGTATWVGGDEGCDHIKSRTLTSLANSTLGVSKGQSSYDAAMRRQMQCFEPFSQNCGKCGATRIDSQIGLEKTPEEYVAKIVAVFREVKRVLRDDGVVFMNLGDSYCTGTSAGRQPGNADFAEGTAKAQQIARNGNCGGLKPKDLVGIPWRCAFALQADGWYLRSDIIWSKPNPMPESVTDRPTKSHEYIFLLTKKERYFFDQDAVREVYPQSTIERMQYPVAKVSGDKNGVFSTKTTDERVLLGLNPAGRNIRTVWEIATQAFPSAHFATFPEEIAVRCIKAGTSEKGACAECGAPWERVVETTKTFESGSGRSGNPINGKQNLAASTTNSTPDIRMGPTVQSKTTGWQPTCNHIPDAGKMVPCIVLDPFSGAGTVPLVADKLNRRGIGLELKPDYCRMANRRCYDDAPLLSHTG